MIEFGPHIPESFADQRAELIEIAAAADSVAQWPQGTQGNGEIVDAELVPMEFEGPQLNRTDVVDVFPTLPDDKGYVEYTVQPETEAMLAWKYALALRSTARQRTIINNPAANSIFTPKEITAYQQDITFNEEYEATNMSASQAQLLADVAERQYAEYVRIQAQQAANLERI